MTKRHVKTLFTVMLSICLATLSLSARTIRLVPPNGKTSLNINVQDRITLSLKVDRIPVLRPSPISMTLDKKTVLGKKPIIKKITRKKVNTVITPEIKQKTAHIDNRYNQRTIQFRGGYAIEFRAYDNGVAYRFVTDIKAPVTVVSEEAAFRFAGDFKVWFPEEESFQSHNERYYKYLSLSEIPKETMCSLPALVEAKNGIKIAITETDLEDYPGMWLNGCGKTTLEATFPAVPKTLKMKKDRHEIAEERHPYIAQTKGSRTFPWRVLAISRTDGELITNQLTYLLAKPTALEDTSWIRPGQVAWDWWNANNLYGVDFKAGVNTETYKYYIDFAAQHGIEYIILDEGWYPLGDLLSLSPGIDMQAIMAHAREKNIGVILWVIWKTLDNQLHEALDRFAEWGVQGIKVDFMQRDDQIMVNYYHKIAHEAAKRKLLVDFHGSYKPSGLRRLYPNVMTREGVRGLEQCKWSDKLTPAHNVTIPFIRMLAGPMDYTPGAMHNAQKENFRPIFNRPMSMGTRCHQLAMYMIYESPLQMLADSPSNYLKEPECASFIAAVPTTWDETVVLHAKVGRYIALARRNGDRWYVGAMTNGERRELELDLSFLGTGAFTAEIMSDGINAHRAAVDYQRQQLELTPSQTLTAQLAPGGGWAAIITPKD